MKLEAAIRYEELEKQGAILATLKPSQMSRLQRSMVHGRVPAVAKDSTVRVATFLKDFLDMLAVYLRQTIVGPDAWKVGRLASYTCHRLTFLQLHKSILTSAVRYWNDTYLLASSKQFEEATFQAHLEIGRDLFSTLIQRVSSEGQSNTHELVRHLSSKLHADFSTGFKLTTGLSMEILWVQLRSMPISKIEILQTLMQMEQLAGRFDALRWKTSVSVAELANIMDSLVKTYQLVRTSDADVQQLVQTLSTELEALETRTGAEAVDIKPFFLEQFEALRQYRALEATRTGDREILDTNVVVLADHPTASLMRLSGATESSKPLQNVDFIWGRGNGLHPIKDNVAASLLHQLHDLGEVDLKSLRLLETELPILGQKVSSLTELLSRDQLHSMNDILRELISGIVAAHDVDLGEQIRSWTAAQDAAGQQLVATTANIPAHVKQVVSDFFEPALRVMQQATETEDRYKSTSLAWIYFAIGCLTLFVPDRPFDPDRRQWLEREQHVRMKEVLQSKIYALRQFENLFSNQDSNLCVQLLEDELRELGEPKEALQKIYRPEVSELDQLQGEFNNLLNAVVHPAPHTKLFEAFQKNTEGGLQELQLLQGNVAQIVRRLSERFAGYSDMTVPIVGMLRCLQIGLSMAEIASGEESASTTAISRITQLTPFLGGRPSGADSQIVEEHPLEFLAAIAAASDVEGVKTFTVDRRQALFNAFHTCFDQWTKKLESDRKEAESKSGLYRFRGSAEDEDEIDQEQFNELFPSFDSEESDEVHSSSVRTTRDTAVDLANIHASIFVKSTPPTNSILSLIRSASTRVGGLYKDNAAFKAHEITAALLPGALLTLDDKLASLTTSEIDNNTYNFYTDANLPEARKLVALVHQIQRRFLELQDVDEIGHMQPLEDVLVSCRELLEFRHTEPVAKIITKVEKVHTYLHEWQFGGWASRANSALALYDDLTATIVNWRRLELSTWARLFDMEDKKCDDDAKSWWFVAYQVVIAGPLSVSDSVDELKSYAQKLLQDLEAYFGTAIQGQLIQRLQLLKQLQKHVELLMLDIPNLSIINTALINFIDVYTRFEKPVMENLRKGRQTLEKAMKDVLLLASWKDTNIVALRDSARRSHHKLFKLVRKYRTLLGQPMDVFLKQGLPDENESDNLVILSTVPQALPLVDKSALDLCEQSVPHWSKKSKRFVNVSKTVAMMDNNSQIPVSAVDVAEYLDSFVANLITTSAELQKSTPSILTEDNKDEVKHLKTRKRKLFADTLKELRQMGVKYNLGVNALAKQESLSVVLANTAHLPTHDNIDRQGIEYYYHKTLDLMPKAREGTRQHSDDLSGAEAARSAGYLEGLLQILVKQRNSLSSAINSAAALDQAVALMQAIWAPNVYTVKHMTLESSHAYVLQWLPNILRIALELMGVYTRLGKLDSKACQTVIAPWVDIFVGYANRWDSLPKVPGNVVSTDQEVLVDAINDSLQQFSAELDDALDTYPALRFILRQIISWTEVKVTAKSLRGSRGDITKLDKKISSVCDTVLVAIEKLNKSMAGLPESTEDPSWLIKNEACLSENIRNLHCDDITGKIDEAFMLLNGLDIDNEAVSKTAGATFAVALPIFQQYSSIVRQSVARYAALHRATCKMSYVLAKSFAQISAQGFCTPSEKSDAQDGKTEKLEGGTGLGDGEGADDISKDIQEDENLDELAQEPNTGDKEEIEDQEDAVDMADGEMEGEMGEAPEKDDDEEGSGDEESGDEMDEETGDVDDLDPNAVDEKMWDGDGDEAEKDQEGDDSKGKASKDEQVAAQENNKDSGDGDEGQDGEEEEEEEDMAGDEQGEDVKQQDDIEKHDPHAQEEEALDLPDDMDLDGDGKSEGSVDGDEDGMDDLGDLDDDIKEGDEVEDDGNDADANPEGEDAEGQEDQDMGDNLDVIDLDEENEGEEGDKTDQAGEEAEEAEEPEQKPDEEQEGLLQDRTDDANADPDNAAPSDVKGVGEDQDENEPENNDSSTAAQREDGGKGGDSSEDKQTAAEDGEKGRQANGEAPQGQDEDTQDTADAQPFKKLGDALERWHRQQTQIRDPSELKDEAQDKDQDQQMDLDGENQEFEHLQDENAEADTQALGTATEDQAHTLDESMAVESESKDLPEQFQPDEVEQDDVAHDQEMDLEEQEPQEAQDSTDAHEGRAGAMIQQAERDDDHDMDDYNRKAQPELEDEVEEVDTQLSSTHLEDATALSLSRSPDDARQLWTHYESLTRDLSLSLTEQLRLILAPTLATKMRGDFRTGKRLNIKRIIPYIASSFKRDKIWMRRSVPSKRSYQIMLAVDDSKSMGESGSGSLAFETLVMVSKSLSMLEVGEICVVGFGEEVKVAHEFDSPFSADAGPKVFQNFGFEQKRTDVTKLVRESIDLFRTARAKASSSPADLWQLQLILSDGVCDSSEHEPIRRLLREAIEERIMMVFVIVDDLKNKKKGESVMDLKEAKFVKNEMTGASQVKIERYLDTFPFQYYLIVSDVRELPGVLATLLRQWFSEVVDSSN
jgi:midasin